MSGVSRSRNGYVERLDYKCVHPTWAGPTFSNGRLDNCKLGDLGGESFSGGRVTLLWTPSETVRVKVITDITNEDNESAALTLIRVNPAFQQAGYGANGWAENPANTIPNPAGGPPLIFAEGTFLDNDGDMTTLNDRVYLTNEMVTSGPFRGDPLINDPYVSYATFLDPMPRQLQDLPANPAGPSGRNRPFSPTAVDPGVEFDQQGVSVQVDWDITDNLALTWVSAMREYEDIWAQDTDASPFNTQVLTQGVSHEHSTHEIRFSGVGLNDRLDYTLGAFYVDQNKAIQIGNINLHYANLNFIHGPDPTPSDSTAIFAHTTWHLTDDLNLSVGYRATEDNKFYQYRRRNPDGTLPLPCNGPPAWVGANPNCVLAGLDLASASFSSDRSDYRVALDYHITDDVMIYGQVATGYKGGGINPRPFFLVQIEEFGEEELESFEVGVKTTLANGTVRLNGALFQNDYTDMQLTQQFCELPGGGFGPPCAQPGNVGDSDVSGAELELEIAPNDNLLIDMSIASLDFEYTRISPAVPGVTLDMITPFTPETTWSFGVQYEWPLSGGGSFTGRLDATFQDDVYAAAINLPTNLIEDYTLSHARFTWRSAARDWEAALDISNLTDEVYYLNLFDQFSSTGGAVSGGIAPPRLWTVSLKRSFGL